MAVKILSPEEAKRALELGKSKLRPASIVAARTAYEQDRATWEAQALKTSLPDLQKAAELVKTKRAIDSMYTRWINGEFANEELVEDPFL